MQYISPWLKKILSDKNMKYSSKEAALRKELRNFHPM